jgi:antitoxin Phd
MKTWSTQDASTRFDEFLDACLREGPQIVSKGGIETAVLVPMRDWQRLRQAPHPTLKQLLLADAPRMEFPLATRRRRRRAPKAFLYPR